MKIKTLLALAVLFLVITPAIGQNQVHCVVEASTATSITAVGGDCAGEVGLSHFIESITASSSAAAGTSADSMLTLKYGTGTTCGTGTTIVFIALSEANTTVGAVFPEPIRIPPENDLCWIHSVAGTKTWVINGRSGP